MESARYDLEFREGQPRLGGLKPVLSPHAKISTHVFRGQVWSVAQDPVSLQYFRFGSAENRVVKLLDGEHSLRDIHQELQRELGGEAPSFQDIVIFVQMLRSTNLLQAQEAEKLDALFKRVQKRRTQQRKALMANFLFPRIPLFDPDRFLTRTVRYVGWLFRPWFLVLWFVAVAAGIVTFFYHIGEIAKPAQGVLAPENILLLWVSFVVLKIFHEFAHAYLAKYYGAEVHRIGIMFLVFTPVAFVDVTDLWDVESKHKRALVASAGMMMDLFIAAIALVVWLATEPGIIHSLAYNIIFISSISSVLFNGNPLLRFDAYYILSDWAELPNLWTNSRRYILYLGKRYILGLDEDPPTPDTREKVWLVVYGIASLLYRTLVVVGIILFVSSVLFGLGVLLGIAATFAWVLLPIGKLVHYLLFAKATRRKRLRCIAAFVVIGTAIIYPLARVPFPQHVYAPCAVVEQERAAVRARWRGFVDKVHVRDGQRVTKGQLVAECINEDLGYDVLRTEKDLAISRIRLAAFERDNDVPAAQAERYRIRSLGETLAVLRQRVDCLRLLAPCDGQLIAPGIESAPGLFLNSGSPLALVARGPFTKVVVVMDQAGVADVAKARDKAVLVRLRSAPDRAVECRVVKDEPKATYQAPSPGLTNAGGGPVLLDPSVPEGTRTLLPWFRIELELPSDAVAVKLGTTGQARFTIAQKPLFDQWYYKLRRLLSTRFFMM